MDGVVIYASKYGSTQEYAQWISQETGLPLLRSSAAKNLPARGTLVVGCSILAGKPTLGPWIINYLENNPTRKIILFTTSGAPKEDPQHFINFKTAFPERFHQNITYFPLGGRMILSKLSWLDRLFMKLGAHVLGKKDPALGKKMLEDVDRVNKDDLGPLLKILT